MTDDDIAAIVSGIVERARAVLARHGLLDDEHGLDVHADPLSLDEPSLAAAYGSAVTGRAQFGHRRGQRAHRIGSVAGPVEVSATGRLCAQAHGFNLHAAVQIHGRDRLGLERLCRYIARPPIAHDRLELVDDEHVAIELKRPWSDGTTSYYTSLSLVVRFGFGSAVRSERSFRR